MGALAEQLFDYIVDAPMEQRGCSYFQSALTQIRHALEAEKKKD